MEHGDIVNRFTYHPPSEKDIKVYQAIRSRLGNFAVELNDYLPDSREKSLAITHLEEVVFWANAAVARHGTTDNLEGID